MRSATSWLVIVCGVVAVFSPSVRAQGDSKPYNAPACSRILDDYFAREFWPKVGAVVCLQCHKKGGDAEESKLILLDPLKFEGHARDEAMRKNRDAFARLASVKEKEQARLLVKPTGGLDHGGGDVLKPGSKGLAILTEFVRRVNAPPSAAPAVVDDRNLPPFFADVTMLDDKRLLRRATPCHRVPPWHLWHP